MKKWQESLIQEARELLSEEHIDTKTSIFRDFPGVYKLDPKTREHIQESLHTYLSSNVIPLLIDAMRPKNPDK
jgi:hypothetical protein